MAVLKDYLAQCQHVHGDRCKPITEVRSSSSRIIDCTKRIIVPTPSDCKYTALSYVWGPKPSSMRLQDAPATIEDSIIVTLALGLRYLWVDRYCIDQDDAVDTHDQIRRMSRIYGAAQFTIIAASGKDPSFGLPGVGVRLRHGISSRCNVDGIHLFVPQPWASTEVATSSWHSRAWTYQECFFSRRRLFFTGTQVLYLCNSGKQSELPDIPDDRSPPIQECLPFGTVSSVRKFNNFAERQLMAYSRRVLSYDTDALNAIRSSLESLTEGSRPTYHICGVPVECCASVGRQQPDPVPLNAWSDLKAITPAALDHGFVDISFQYYHPNLARRRHGFPSWSMLGWDGSIDWRSSPFKFRATDVVLSNSRTDCEKLSLASAFSTSSSAVKVDQAKFIHLTAYVGSISAIVSRWPKPPDTIDEWPLSNAFSNLIKLAYNDDTDLLMPASWDTIPSKLETLVCVGTEEMDHLLILEKSEDTYYRVGIGSTFIETYIASFQDWKTGEIQSFPIFADGRDWGILIQEWWKSFSRLQTIVIG